MTIINADKRHRKMEYDDNLEQDYNDTRSVTYDPSLDGFCPSDPMFSGVFDMARSAGSQAFSNQLTTAHEGSSHAAHGTH